MVAAGNLLRDEEIPAEMVAAFQRAQGHLADGCRRRWRRRSRLAAKRGRCTPPACSRARRALAGRRSARRLVRWRSDRGLRRLWGIYKPQLEVYVTRALNPRRPQLRRAGGQLTIPPRKGGGQGRGGRSYVEQSSLAAPALTLPQFGEGVADALHPAPPAVFRRRGRSQPIAPASQRMRCRRRPSPPPSRTSRRSLSCSSSSAVTRKAIADRRRAADVARGGVATGRGGCSMPPRAT